MSGIRPRLSHDGPDTRKVSAPVKGGQVLEAVAGGLVRPASAGSKTVVGVSEVDATPARSAITTDQDGFETINLSPLPEHATFGFARYPVVYAADAAYGVALKAAANGTVTPLLDADPASMKIGYCDEPLGVVVATKATGLANISR